MEQMLQALKQRFPCSPWCRPWEGSCVPVAHGDPQWSRDPPVACGESHVLHVTHHLLLHPQLETLFSAAQIFPTLTSLVIANNMSKQTNSFSKWFQSQLLKHHLFGLVGFLVFLNQHAWSRTRRRAALRQRKTDGKKFQIHLTMLFASLCLTCVTVSVQHSSTIEM